MKIDLKVIGTGSSGNCLILNNEIAFDMGVNYLENVSDLKTIFISHLHLDHIVGLRNLSQYYNLHSLIVPSAYEKNLKQQQLSSNNERIYYQLDATLINKTPSNCVILATFDVCHDVLNYGYVLLYHNKLIVYATDIGDYSKVYIAYKHDVLSDTYTFYTYTDLVNGVSDYTLFDLYLIECNHSVKTLTNNLNNVKNSSRKKYFTRSLKTHLSTDNFYKLYQFFMYQPTLLLHRSVENLPLDLINYYFVNDINANSLKVAINPFEKRNLSENIINELHLTDHWIINI